MSGKQPIVCKFGGTSVADVAAMRGVASIILMTVQQAPCIAIASACAGVTDLLLRVASAAPVYAHHELIEELSRRHLHILQEIHLCAEQRRYFEERVLFLLADMTKKVEGVALLGECSPRLRAVIVSYGELLSTTLLHAVCCEQGIEAEWGDSRNCIVTESDYPEAKVIFPLTRERTKAWFSGVKSDVAILPGFIAADVEGRTTILGRGGSDYTAGLVGAALGAAEVQIWKEVSGILSADPRKVQNATTVPMLPFEAMEELALYGVKAVHHEAIRPAVEYHIPVRIKNTFMPQEQGTSICAAGECSISGIVVVSTREDCLFVQAEGAALIAQTESYLQDLYRNGSSQLLAIEAPHRRTVLLTTTPETPFVETNLPDYARRSVGVICCGGKNLRKKHSLSIIEQALQDMEIIALFRSSDTVVLIVVPQEVTKEALNLLHTAIFNQGKTA